MFDLTGRLALVTGASRGIGAGISVALAAAGADVVGTSRSGRDSSTADAVRSSGRRFHSIQADCRPSTGRIGSSTPSRVSVGPSTS